MMNCYHLIEKSQRKKKKNNIVYIITESMYINNFEEKNIPRMDKEK